MNLDQKLEAILFAGAKPFSVKRLAEITKSSNDEVQTALHDLGVRLESSGNAIMLQSNGSSYELVTHPDTADEVSEVMNDDVAGELTRPSLEALSILSYCGPLTRPELEQIRGVQSSMIIRNLMIRGLIEEKEDTRLGQPMYSVTFDFLNHLGIKGVEDLPDYQNLRGHGTVQDVLRGLETTQNKEQNQENK